LIKRTANLCEQASIDGRIEYVPDLAENEPKVYINSTEIQHAGSDPMGQVSGGSIHLRTMVIKMDPYGNIPGHLEIKLHKIYDVPNEIANDPRGIYQSLLWITRTSGLIVWPAKVKVAGETYERVGYFSKMAGDTSSYPSERPWFPSSVITLV